jgi:hypothetical protein
MQHRKRLSRNCLIREERQRLEAQDPQFGFISVMGIQPKNAEKVSAEISTDDRPLSSHPA